MWCPVSSWHCGVESLPFKRTTLILLSTSRRWRLGRNKRFFNPVLIGQWPTAIRRPRPPRLVSSVSGPVWTWGRHSSPDFLSHLCSCVEFFRQLRPECWYRQTRQIDTMVRPTGLVPQIPLHALTGFSLTGFALRGWAILNIEQFCHRIFVEKTEAK